MLLGRSTTPPRPPHQPPPPPDAQDMWHGGKTGAHTLTQRERHTHSQRDGGGFWPHLLPGDQRGAAAGEDDDDENEDDHLEILQFFFTVLYCFR